MTNVLAFGFRSLLMAHGRILGLVAHSLRGEEAKAAMAPRYALATAPFMLM